MSNVVRCLMGALVGALVGGGVSFLLLLKALTATENEGQALPAVLLLAACGAGIGALVGLGISLLRINTERREGANSQT